MPEKEHKNNKDTTLGEYPQKTTPQKKKSAGLGTLSEHYQMP